MAANLLSTIILNFTSRAERIYCYVNRSQWRSSLGRRTYFNCSTCENYLGCEFEPHLAQGFLKNRIDIGSIFLLQLISILFYKYVYIFTNDQNLFWVVHLKYDLLAVVFKYDAAVFVDFHQRFYGVMVSTLDLESSDLSSNLSRT